MERSWSPPKTDRFTDLLSIPFHPALWALFPVISLLGTHIRGVPPRLAIRSILLLPLVTLAAFGILGWWLHRRKTAALLSFLILTFFSAHRVANLFVVSGETSAEAERASGNWVLIVILLGAMLISFLLLRTSSELQELTIALNIAALVSLVLPLSTILRLESIDRLTSAVPPLDSFRGPVPSLSTQKPDIYYIILDDYGSEDVLREGYDVDVSPFLAELEKAGFYVATNSTCNYAQTALSMASSLNMSHLQYLRGSVDPDSGDQHLLPPLIQHSLVRQETEGQGYRWVAFETDYRRTEITDASNFLTPRLPYVNPFESQILNGSMVPFVYQLPFPFVADWALPGYAYHRALIGYVLKELERLAEVPGPKFVFAHIVAPHPPFVFSATGQARNPNHPFDTSDGDQFQGSQAEYIQGYRDQVIYLNSHLLPLVRRIIEMSRGEAVIILQGDHGPGARLVWAKPSSEALWERSGILNAMYVPSRYELPFYPEITPVNTFRMLNNGLFGTDLSLLPDRFYYSSVQRPFSFTYVPAPIASP